MTDMINLFIPWNVLPVGDYPHQLVDHYCTMLPAWLSKIHSWIVLVVHRTYPNPTLTPLDGHSSNPSLEPLLVLFDDELGQLEQG
jgi:hypothetical protein